MFSICPVPHPVKVRRDIDELAAELVVDFHDFAGTSESDPSALSPSQYAADLRAAAWLLRTRGVFRVSALLRALSQGRAAQYGIRRLINLAYRLDFLQRRGLLGGAPLDDHAEAACRCAQGGEAA